MVISTVTTSTFLRDTLLIVRDELDANLTDPISRTSGEKFVTTEYPKRNTTYPIITVTPNNISFPVAGGIQSRQHKTTIPIEIRVWARRVSERDRLTQDVINQLRNFTLDSDGSVNAGLFDFQLLSSVPVSEDGEQGVKSMVMEVSYSFMLGS